MEFFGIPITEEMAEHLDHQYMEADSYRHDVQRLFDELPKDHLFTLRLMLNHFATDETPRLAAYYEGVVAATIAHRFGICGGCGQDHDAVLGRFEGKDDAPKKSTEADEDAPRLFEMPGPITPAALEAVLEQSEAYPLTSDDTIHMLAYNLDDLRDEDTNELLGFICKSCGLRYVSIEDRMLRAPDACHGCHLKSAHG